MDGKDPCAETACVQELSGIVCPLGAIVIYPSHDQKKAENCVNFLYANLLNITMTKSNPLL